MTEPKPDYLSFACPRCRKRLRAPLALAGQKLNCPKCASAIEVPETPIVTPDELTTRETPGEIQRATQPLSTDTSTPSEADSDEMQLSSAERKAPPNLPRRSVFDDDLPDLLPLHEDSTSVEATPQKSSRQKDTKTPQSKQSDPYLSDVQRQALEQQKTSSGQSSNQPASPRSKSSVDAHAEDIQLESSALGDDFSIPTDEEFRFTCRVCGTLLSANKSRIGTKTRCPDCYSEFLIPKPVEKRKAPEIKLDENIQVKLQPIEARNSRVDFDVNRSTKEMLSNAAVEADKERQEIDQVNYAFDTNRWLGLIFGFLYDPMVVVVASGLGFITCFWLVGMDSIGTTIKMSSFLALVLRVLLFGFFFIPIGGTIFLCGIAILTMAANRSTRVTDWPFSKLGDSISEGIVVLVAFLISGLPGGIVGTMVSSLGAQTGVTTGLELVSIWGFFPIVLLSMINNNSVFEPYSKRIVETMKSHGDAWGAMYIQSGLAFAFLFALCIVTLLRGILGEIICGLLLPLVTFFIFNQYGVLAGRISTATELGFHGDFSDD